MTRSPDAAGVREVTGNAAVEPQGVDASKLKTAFPASVNAPQAWNTSGIESTGRGVGVAVIDTGIDSDLADFRDADGSSRVVASAVVNPDATDRPGRATATARTSPASSPATRGAAATATRSRAATSASRRTRT